MGTFALQARWVLPITQPPLQHGVVTVDDGRIVGVGAKPAACVPAQDLGDVILMPGLVNAHSHLEFSDLERPLGSPGSSLPDWIRLVIANRKQQQKSQTAVQAGLDEAIRSGVTTIGEISTSPFCVENSVPIPDVTAFQEVIGFSAARVDSVFADLQTRMQASHTARQLGISPHAPYTVHPTLVERLTGHAQAHSIPVAMHLAESREELQLLQENSGPFRELLEERSMWDNSVFGVRKQAMDYLEMLSQAPRALVIHGNYLSTDEIDYISQRPQMSIVYCPRTHAYSRHEKYPLEAILSRGITLAIGTDSRASNPDLDLLAELRFLAESHPELQSAQIVAMGTQVGAKALGLEHELGSLDEGKLANMAVIDNERSDGDPHEQVLFGNQIRLQTWIHGQLVYSSSS